MLPVQDLGGELRGLDRLLARGHRELVAERDGGRTEQLVHPLVPGQGLELVDQVRAASGVVHGGQRVVGEGAQHRGERADVRGAAELGVGQRAQRPGYRRLGPVRPLLDAGVGQAGERDQRVRARDIGEVGDVALLLGGQRVPGPDLGVEGLQRRRRVVEQDVLGVRVGERGTQPLRVAAGGVRAEPVTLRHGRTRVAAAGQLGAVTGQHPVVGLGDPPDLRGRRLHDLDRAAHELRPVGLEPTGAHVEGEGAGDRVQVDDHPVGHRPARRLRVVQRADGPAQHLRDVVHVLPALPEQAPGLRVLRPGVQHGPAAC